MKHIAALALIIIALSFGSAKAQTSSQAQVVSSCGAQSYAAGTTRASTQDTTGKGCINASATLSGFRPTAYGTPISVTTGGVTGTLPTNTGEVVATNVGTTNGAYCALGGSATTSSQYIAPNGGWFAFAISGDTQLTCITSASTTTVNTAGGSGLPTGTGGGGGGGSGGAVTIADGADVTEGAKADSAWSGSGSGSVVAILKALWVAITGPIPACSASPCTTVIGVTAIDQTTDGTTNAVHLKAGTAIAGKFGIDQTTPGTTNAVQATNFPATVDTNTGNASASTPRVVIATNQPAVPVSTGCAGATIANTKTKPFSNAGSATSLLLVTGVSSQKVYICGINIGPVAGAVNVALVEGTTVSTACDTGTAGLAGGATAATGWQFAANGGLTMGSGTGIIAVEATNADNACLLFSAGVQVSGVITYAQF